MASFINTNMVSLNTQNNLSKSQGALATSIQRLSSGMRVNSAKDDAAGMAIANGMQATIKGQTVAMRNANDAISFSQTAEGALGKINDNLQRMRELAVQSANATNSGDDRASLNTEFTQLQAEITRVQGGTKFNGTAVLDAGAHVFQIGSGTTANVDTITTTTAASTNTSAAAASTVDITDIAKSTAAITAIDLALKENNTASINEGATQNRFSAVISTLSVSVENQTQARSRIMDTDYAAETATLARGQILQQAGMAMLAQANQLPNGVMALMR
jgi:flagellin